jgi:hypothetical protein
MGATLRRQGETEEDVEGMRTTGSSLAAIVVQATCTVCRGAPVLTQATFWKIMESLLQRQE